MTTNFFQLSSPYTDYDAVSFSESDSPAASDFDSFDELPDDGDALPSNADLMYVPRTNLVVRI